MSQSHFQNESRMIFMVQYTHHVDYFIVLIDASTRWSYICLLSTLNQALAKFLAQLIKLRAHIPDYPIKKNRLDNLVNLHLMLSNEYCMSIEVEHPVALVHTQNGLVESLIKRLKLIA